MSRKGMVDVYDFFLELTGIRLELLDRQKTLGLGNRRAVIR